MVVTRCITFGLYVDSEDFLNETICTKFDVAQETIQATIKELATINMDVQTTRLSLNSFEEWAVPLLEVHKWTVEQIVEKLVGQLVRLKIQFCSIGCCSSLNGISLLPDILSLSNLLNGSVSFKKTNDTSIAPDFSTCQSAAKVCLDLLERCGELGNFRYCTSFNCNSGTPFFPVAYHDGKQSTVSIGFENGDLMSLAFEGVASHNEGREKLLTLMTSAYKPVQEVAQRICDKYDVVYLGIDASINPGLSIAGSIATGLEHLIFPVEKTHFGSMGTLAAVSTVTSAVKALNNADNGIKLVGYNGLMLPVMEDLRLAELAALPSPAYSLRDLLTFSSVCGVGLDTVPIPGTTTVDELAGVYMEVGAMAFRLNKPLTCRLLPMVNKQPGDMTSVDSPYLCNTRVFALNM